MLENVEAQLRIDQVNLVWKQFQRSENPTQQLYLEFWRGIQLSDIILYEKGLVGLLKLCYCLEISFPDLRTIFWLF